MSLVKIEGHPELMKDTNSGAILYVDRKADNEYQRQKRLINSQKQTQQDISDMREKLEDLETVKQEMQEIKALLKELVSK
jgi:hypothetical protein